MVSDAGMLPWTATSSSPRCVIGDEDVPACVHRHAKESAEASAQSAEQAAEVRRLRPGRGDAPGHREYRQYLQPGNVRARAHEA